MITGLLQVWRRDRRGTVAVMFAAMALPVLIGVGVAVEFSRMTVVRSALQRAADNAALSGAAAYVVYTQTDDLNAVARAVATSTFCNATTALPAGFALVAQAGGSACPSHAGPAVTAVVAGYRTGTRGTIAASGCSSSNTVVANATCGFVVTVAASGTITSSFPTLFGQSRTISVTSSAVNPFIDIAMALSAVQQASAKFANSIWVYPLLLDANGSPAVTASNPGALPDTSACTGDPAQTSCGSYSMLSSTNYQGCPGQTTPSCTVGATVFGAGGVITNPAAGAAIITATTPLGIGFQSSAGGGYAEPAGVHANYGYDRSGAYYGAATPYKAPGDACVWPWHTAYNTVSQVYDPAGRPIYPWSLVTHWFYSSYLLQNMPPSQGEITAQLDTTTDLATGYAKNLQTVHATPDSSGGSNVPVACTSPVPSADYQRYSTSYTTSGRTNCSLYVVRDPSSLVPDASYVGSCFDPANTPGQKYAAFSCQSLTGHSLAFFWNDMGGGGSDDADYGNGTLLIGCSGQPRVQLIN